MQTTILLIIFISVVGACLLISCSKEQEEKGKHNPITIVFNGKNLEFFNILNDYRDSLGLEKVKGEKLLTELATEHCYYMVANDTCSHYGNGHRELTANALGYGEILSYNYQTEQSRFIGYFNSLPHKAVMEGDFTSVGIDEMNGFQCVIFAKY